MPHHVGLIVDGNRRYAMAKGLAKRKGCTLQRELRQELGIPLRWGMELLRVVNAIADMTEDEGSDVDLELLTGVYERIRAAEFRSGSDHVTQVMKVQQTIVSKCPNLAVPYRRLVCYCRLYEVIDPTKKDRPGEAGNGACARVQVGAVWSQIVGVIGLVNVVVLRQCGGPIRRLAKGTFARSGNEMFGKRNISPAFE